MRPGRRRAETSGRINRQTSKQKGKDKTYIPRETNEWPVQTIRENMKGSKREHHENRTDLQSKTGNKAKDGRGDTNKNPENEEQRLIEPMTYNSTLI